MITMVKTTMKSTMTLLAAAACLGTAAWGGTVAVSDWATLKSNLEAGNSVKLTQNVVQDGLGVAISGKSAALDLNGFTITGSSQTDGSYRPLTLSNGANLTLADGSAAKTGTIDGQGVSRSVDGGCVFIGSGCSFTMTGGTISGHYSTGNGGALYCAGTFTTSGGTVSGCRGAYGGGLYFWNGLGALNAGTITDCAATYGGAFSLQNSGTVDVRSGMSISRNSAVSHGAVFLQGGTINVYGGTFADNAVSTGVLTGWGGALNVYGGVFSGNSVKSVYRQAGTAAVYGGVYDVSPGAELIATGYVEAQVGDNRIVGRGIVCDANGKLLAGTVTFCPTNAEYAAVGVAIGEKSEVLENETDPKTWTVCLTEFLAMPTPVAHATAAVYTNGVLSAETSIGSCQWYAKSNEAATVVYTAHAGYDFEGGATMVTNVLDTTVNPAVNADAPPMMLVPVLYVDENGEAQRTNACSLASSRSRVTWSGGWYVVEDSVTVAGGADVNGPVKLVLADGAKLSIFGVAQSAAGIGVTGDGNSFTVYGQVGDTGALSVAGGSYGAGIGGGDGGTGSNITINGGRVTATGGECGAGIGGGRCGAGSVITVNGGRVTATGGENCAGIGGGWSSSGSDIHVANNVILMAGASADSTKVIPHTNPATDIASLLADSRYATTIGIVNVSTWADLKCNLEAGNDVRLVADIAQDAPGVVLAGKTAVLDLNGFTIAGSDMTDGAYRPFTLTDGADLTLTDCSDAKTGAIDGKSVLRDISGGCAYVGLRCSYTMNGGAIINFSATEGGAIYCTGGRVTMNGGTLSGNYATSFGYAIRLFGADPGSFVITELTIRGGRIANNRGYLAGAISSDGYYDEVIPRVSIRIYGGVMHGNSSVCAGTTAQWLNIQARYTSCYIYSGVFDAEPSVDNILYDRRIRSMFSIADYSPVEAKWWIFGNDIVYAKDERLTGGTYTFCPTNAEYVAAGVSPPPNVTVTASGSSYTLAATGTVDVASWKQVKLNLEVGYDVRLAADVAQDVPGVALDGKTTALDLNGFTIAGCGHLDGAYRPLTLSNGANLTLADSSVAKTGAIDGQGVYRGVNGGCVSVGSGCTFTMTGGTITNCAALHGGGVFVDGDGAFDLSGGTITGNISAEWGGGVYLIYGATMVFSTGEISYNTANGAIGGGGICSSGRVTMKGGVLVGNQSTGNAASTAFYSNWDDGDAICGGVIGGTIFRADAGDLIISGGAFDRDQSPLVASGLACTKVGSNWIIGNSIASDANDKLTGGSYMFCMTNAEYVAAGVFVAPNASVAVSGTVYSISAAGFVDVSDWVQVKANLQLGNCVRLLQDVLQDSPGVVINGKTVALDLNGSTITGSNQTDETHRPLTLTDGANLTLSDGSETKAGAIDGRGVSRVGNGGCVYVGSGCAFTMNGGTITSCTAAGQGGAIYDSGAFTMNGGMITNCTAGSHGGAIYDQGAFTMNGGVIANCAAVERGGAIYDQGAFTMNGGTITGNLAGDAASTAVYSSANNGDVIRGGVVKGTILRYAPGDLVAAGGVFDCDQSVLSASGTTCVLVDSNWIVGSDLVCTVNGELIAGTFTFCPTNAEYAAEGVVFREKTCVRENATDPKTWTIRPTDFLAVPIPVAHASASVYTNGILSAETSSGSGEWYVWANEMATVVYTAEDGYFFDGGMKSVTNALDTAVTPAVNAGCSPEVLVEVRYVDEEGEMRMTNAHPVASSIHRVTWNTGWYVVDGDVTISGGAGVAGEVKLILADGAKLSVNGTEWLDAGVAVSGGNSFSVYGQADGTGTLTAVGGRECAGIGGGFRGNGSNITINGGAVVATGGDWGAAIGGGSRGNGSNITINGGTVTAMGCGAGIGGGVYGDGAGITINGGIVTATGGGGAGIGGGGCYGGLAGSGSGITINGGVVTATANLDEAAGIGNGGHGGSASYIAINGGEVMAAGGFGGGGIGCGRNDSCSNIYALDDVIVKAGSSVNRTVLIPHASPSTDIAPLLKGKQYVTAQPICDVSTWADLKAKLEAGRFVRLVADVTQDTAGLAIDGQTAALDLNGFTIAGSSQTDGSYRPLTLSNGANLTLADTSATQAGKIDGQGVSRSVNGGCVSVGSGCTFTMTGGTITNCVANIGGGVAVDVGGAFNLSGGAVTGNTSAQWGGGVYVTIGATMTFGGGEISHNTANDSTYGGGGICSSGRMTMTGGKVTGNHSGNSASTAIYSNWDDSDAILGGVIDGTIFRADTGDLVISGGVFDREQSSLLASGKTCRQVGSSWIVGTGIVCDADDRLTGGTYTFCPTNAEYATAGLTFGERIRPFGNATDPKTWTLRDATILAVPTPVEHATALVYTNGVLSSETSVGSGQWHAWTNEAATVVYTADAGRCFAGGAMAVTNALDTTVDPAVNAVNPPEVAPQVAYVDENGEAQTTNATVIVANGSRVTWNAGWYAVTNDVTITGGADVSGDVKLIIADGAKLTIDGVADNHAGIGVTGDGNSFAVYAQGEGTGALEVTGGYCGAGIGGGRETAGSNIAVNGGKVKATGGNYGAGIGGGWLGTGYDITINGGTVTATGGCEGAGIGGSYGGAGFDIAINGGTVTATGGNYGAGIGGGYDGIGHDITIYGGTVTATGGENAAGIGGGRNRIGYGIYVADGFIVMAGASVNPMEIIPHASPTTDIASSLAGKQYATAETMGPEVSFPAENVGVCSWSWATNMTTILEQMDTMGVKCMQLSLVPWVKPLYGIEYDASLRETFGKGESGDVFLAISNRIAKGEISVLSTMISFPFDRWGSYQAISNSNGIVCNIATNDAVGEAVSAEDPLGLAAWTVCSNLVDQSAAMTAQLGVEYITTEIGYLDKPMMDHGTNANENAVIGLARLYEVHRLCAKHGIRLLFESGQYSGEGTMALIDAYTNRYAGCTFDHGLTVNDIGINYDTANHVIYENDSSTNAFVVMRSRIPQIHVKDTFESRADRVAAGGFAVDVKWGTADVSRKLDTLAFLKAAGFKGNLLVEHEWGNNRVGDINAALKAILLANNDDPNDLWISPAAMTGETAGEKCEAALRAQGFPKTVAGRLADTQLYGGFRGWAEDHELDPDGLVHKSGVILASAYGASAVADPADLRIAVTNLTVSTGGRMEFEIVIEGYDPAMIDENLLKAALGVEGSTELEPGTFSPDALDFEFGEVTDGRLPALVVPREPAPDRFFIRMTAE